jgi:hypothetical protein
MDFCIGSMNMASTNAQKQGSCKPDAISIFFHYKYMAQRTGGEVDNYWTTGMIGMLFSPREMADI